MTHENQQQDSPEYSLGERESHPCGCTLELEYGRDHAGTAWCEEGDTSHADYIVNCCNAVLRAANKLGVNPSELAEAIAEDNGQHIVDSVYNYREQHRWEQAAIESLENLEEGLEGNYGI